MTDTVLIGRIDRHPQIATMTFNRPAVYLPTIDSRTKIK